MWGKDPVLAIYIHIQKRSLDRVDFKTHVMRFMCSMDKHCSFYKMLQYDCHNITYPTPLLTTRFCCFPAANKPELRGTKKFRIDILFLLVLPFNFGVSITFF